MPNLPFDPVSEMYSYLWGWPSRAESAGSIAARLQQMARLLAEAEPAYGELWPFGVRASAPGPVLTLDLQDLARLIERRARFDPPQMPKPASAEGYYLALVNNRRGPDPLYARLRVQAGIYRGAGRNSVELEVQPNGPGWQDGEFARRLFESAIGIWDARWATIWHRRADDERVWQWPRLAWAAERLTAQAVPPYISPYPFPFPFDKPPVLTTTHPQLGGVLEEWREEAPRLEPPSFP